MSGERTSISMDTGEKLIEQSERYIYTVNDFCADHPTGTYILCIDGHVVTVQDGKYFDTWDSGNEIPVYYWEKENK